MNNLRYGNQEKVENKKALQESLEEDVKNFLRSGGKIIKIPKGNEEILKKRPRSAFLRPVNT